VIDAVRYALGSLWESVMNRRAFLAAMSAASLALLSDSAWAGSYLNRSALLLDGSRAERDMVWPRSDDKELVKLVYGVAQARSESARMMAVPKVVAMAHPHLLLVLENCERAYATALAGKHTRFVEHILRARSEDQTFRALIKKIGYALPQT
jgi:hypothetical protein